MTHEFEPTTAFEPQTERYRVIDEANKESFLMTEGSRILVVGSLHSVGASRELLSSKHSDEYDPDVVARAQAVGRQLLAGNMSPKGSPNVYGPSHLTNEERIADATANVHSFLEQLEVDPARVRMLRPERDYTTPLSIVNLDEEPMGEDETGIPVPDKAGDFMYTFNTNELALAARPADCPIAYITAETPKGNVTALLHLATLGVAHDYIEQAKQALDDLGVDWSSVRVQLTPGAHADTYKFTNFKAYNPHEKFPQHADMYTTPVEKVSEDGELMYDYEVDLAAYAYEHTIDVFGIDQKHVFLDTTNTPSPKSGTSSHSRTREDYEVDGDNSRDFYVAIPQ